MVVRRLTRLLLPTPRCVVCAAPAQRHNLCALCQRDLPVPGPACARCALPLPRRGGRCSACAMRTPAWDNAASAFDYAFPVTRLLHGIKYSNRLDMLAALGHACARRLDRTHIHADVIVPVPLHWRRQWQRGFNQALELARPVAARLDVELLGHALRRRHATAVQTTLAAHARERNMRDAFTVQVNVRGARVIVFDDVLTTGATAGAVAHSLRAAGAAHIRVWTCARAHLGIKKPRTRAGFFPSQS